MGLYEQEFATSVSLEANQCAKGKLKASVTLMVEIYRIRGFDASHSLSMTLCDAFW